MPESWTEYASSSYLVLGSDLGVEITNLHTGDTQWLQGDDDDRLTDELSSIAENYTTEDEITERTDYYLSQYFGPRGKPAPTENEILAAAEALANLTVNTPTEPDFEAAEAEIRESVHETGSHPLLEDEEKE